MNDGAWRVAAAAALIATALARTAEAQAPSDAAATTAQVGADGGADLTPPLLVSQESAAYPKQALDAKIEGQVGLELVVDETGHVADARVTAPAGHGFDEAALAAVRRFVFEPAKDHGAPIRSTVQFTYEFRLPPEPAPAAPVATTRAPSPPPPAEIEQRGESTLVVAERPITAASSRTVRDRDFRLRPIASVADVLRVTPGILVVQHAGGGKANQYFLRGFDADHGTDIAIGIDGIPINMVSHAHGQGYADTNFVIPEIVERVEVTKGPYFADQSDLATAGSINLVTREGFEHSSLGFGYGGSPGYGGPTLRGLVVASPKMESMKPLFALEMGRSNGPFSNPERFDRYKLFTKLGFAPTRASTVTIGASSYAGDWYGSGQIPTREVAAGRLDRFATLDPSEGGDSARHQIFASYKLRPTRASEIQALAFVGLYRLDLYSNFTLALRDPENGDQIHQSDRRTFGGGKVSYRVAERVGGVRFDTTVGGNARTDAIDAGLDHTRQRQRLDAATSDAISETSLGAFAKEEVGLTKWLRVVGAGRADFFSFAVRDRLEQADGGTSGVAGASQLSPKASAIVTPIADHDVALDLFANWGHGFHSNDARGVVRRIDPVTPLTRAVGYEGGARARFFDRWDLAAAVWRLDLASENVWVGDEGTTEASGATRRWGVELETRFEITPWLAADLDLTGTKSAFVDNAGNGTSVALAPRTTWAGGLSARHPSGVRGGARFYGVGDRPETRDGFLTAEGFTVFDLHLGYGAKRWDVGLDVENLFDARYKAAQFATTSRLRSDPAVGAPVDASACGSGSRLVTADNGGFGGCQDNHFTPGPPFTARVTTTFYLD